MNSLSSIGDDNFKHPNFDKFLNRQQQQPQPYLTRSENTFAAAGPNTNNKVHVLAPNNPPIRSTTGSSFGNNVRIHHTEMQRYLQGLMLQQSQNNHQLHHPHQQDIMLRQKKMKTAGQSMDVHTVAKSSFLKGGDNNNNSGKNSDSAARAQHMSMSRGNNSARGSGSRRGRGGGGGGGNIVSILRRTSSSPGPGNNGGNNFSPNSNSPTTSPNPNLGGITARQKNDKAVEVYHDRKVIARFRTQTECARYLRATPEAVSYHCSKGGGICNGLVIQPLSSVEVTHMMELLSSQKQHSTDPDAPFFGLFEGAVQCRPKERPQLKPETVGILKEWLLSPDHMDNPYPNQRESEMLMEQTGLDKTQLKHWFNNARKRILKPLLKDGGRKGNNTSLDPPPPRQSKKRGSVDSSDTSGGGSSTGRKSSPKKKRKTSDGVGGENAAGSIMAASASGHGANSASNSPSLPPNSSICGTIKSRSSHATHKMSNMSSSQQRQQQLQFEQERQQERQQQLLMEERRQIRPRQFDDPFQENFARGDSNDSSNGSNSNNGNSNNNMMLNQYDRLMGYNNGMNNEMSHGGDMMYYGDSMGGLMNNNNSRNSFNDSGYGGSSSMGGGGGYQGRGNNGNGVGGFNACMEVNDSNNPYDRFNDYPPSRMNNSNNNARQQAFHHQDLFHQDRFSQDVGYKNNHNDRNSPYCQPLQSTQGHQDPRDLHQGPSSVAAAVDDSARSNAVFKQQVATMAMNEASTAFKDMEDAFAHAKGVLAASRTKRARGGREMDPENNPDDDPMVLEANAHAKKCQSVAMFKLKVSQRASEEAATAYDSYQRMVDGMDGGLMDGSERLMMLPGNDSPF